MGYPNRVSWQWVGCLLAGMGLSLSTAAQQMHAAQHQTGNQGKRALVPLEHAQLPPQAADSVVAYAKTLLGTPYRYASTDPAAGFDCSGFISAVFNHFGWQVPRSSVDFTHYGHEVAQDSCRPGDLILFTGTDSTIKVVGHMGIVVKGADGEPLEFIHSSSGKAHGVTITPLSRYYQGRFVKIIRVLYPHHQ